MATNWNKFNSFVDYLCKGKINFSSDQVNIVLTNTAPVATNAKYADLAAGECGNGNGYTTGGVAVPGTVLSNTNGVETLADGNIVITANTGTLGPFRYAVFVDVTSSDKPLIGWYDYGSSISLNGAAGESFTVQTGGSLLTVQ